MEQQPKSQIVASLKQRHFLFGTREITLTSDNQLTIKENSLFRKDTTQIPLEILQGAPAFSKTFSIKWLINTLVLFGLGWLIYIASTEFNVPALNLITLIFAAGGIYASYQFFYYSNDLVIYRNAYTNDNYLYLWNNKPNSKAFKKFIDKLNSKIEGFEIDKAKSPAEKIELYSQHLAFLHSEKILSNEELSRLSKKVYEKALEME